MVLARALTGVSRDARGGQIGEALRRYEAERKPRTAEIQRSSLANDWLKTGSNADWVYAYDAWTVALP